MKLLLTSGGLKNQKIVDAFKRLHTKPLGDTKVAFIITASLGERGAKWWVVDDYNRLRDIGINEIDIVDIGRDKTEWLPQLEWADIIWVEGGNTKFLMYHMTKWGFAEELPGLLKNRLYVGVSAGSMVIGQQLTMAEKIIYNEPFAEPYASIKEYLGYIPVHILPHYKSDLLRRSEADVLQLTGLTEQPIYALDNDSAIVAENGDIKYVVSSGDWKVFLPSQG